jgi:F-type H+-transporting ATPase subunit epsilon
MLDIKVISPSESLFEGKVSHVTFPGELGSFAVFPMHAPIISSLKKGDIVCFPENKQEVTIHIESGFVEIKNDIVTVCVEK